MSEHDGTLTAVPGSVPVVAYRLVTADGTVLSEHLPERAFNPASTLKLAVLIAAARMLEAGELSLDQPVRAVSAWPSEHDGTEFRFEGAEVDPQWPTDDRHLPLQEVLERMITVSSNEATNVIFDLTGKQAVAQVLADAGCTGSVMGRKYGDALAQAHGVHVNVCTAGDLALLMASAVSGQLVGSEWTRYISSLLARQQDAVVGAVVADGVAWGSKSGWVEGIRHDVAYIGRPGPSCVVLSVCTQGFADHPSAVAAIRSTARALLSVARPTV